LGEVVPVVSKHVQQGATHLERSFQRACVVSIAKYAPAASAYFVHGERQTNREPLQTARERDAVVRLGDQVDVIALHGVLNDPESKSLSPCRQRRADCPKSALLT
jgi:hypothetical protein